LSGTETMIDLFLMSQMIAANPENQKFCAEVVGIPYASDNFTDEEWQRFQLCMSFFERQERRQMPPGAPVSAPRVQPLPVLPYDPSLPLLDA
jgi:hypothetical protein